LWSEHRSVTKVATVSLHSNTYEVDPALVGRKVELVFDPLRGIPRKGSYVGPRIM
jgi:putative transposase